MDGIQQEPSKMDCVMEYIKKISCKIILCSILLMTTTILFANSYPRNLKQYVLQRVLSTDTEKEHNIDLIQYIKNKKDFVFISFLRRFPEFLVLVTLVTLVIVFILLLCWLHDSLYYEKTAHIISSTLIIIIIVILPFLPKTLQNYSFDFALINLAKENQNANIALIEDILFKTSHANMMYKLAKNNPKINTEKLERKIILKGNNRLIYKTMININGVNIEKLGDALGNPVHLYIPSFSLKKDISKWKYETINDDKVVNKFFKPRWVYKGLKNIDGVNIEQLADKFSKPKWIYKVLKNIDGVNIEQLVDKFSKARWIYKVLKNIDGVNIKQLTDKFSKPKWIYKVLKNIDGVNVNSLCNKLSQKSGLYTTKAIKKGLCNGIY